MTTTRGIYRDEDLVLVSQALEHPSQAVRQLELKLNDKYRIVEHMRELLGMALTEAATIEEELLATVKWERRIL